MAKSGNRWWWDKMTRREQEEYVRDHPHTDMVPNAPKSNVGVVNPDRAKSVELLRRLRNKQRDLGIDMKSDGFPAASTDLVKHLNNTDHPDAKELLGNLKSTWDAFNKEYRGKVSNPKLFGMWAQHLKSSFPKDILKVREKLMDDRSSAGRAALQSIDAIIGARKDFGALTHAAQISREFSKIALGE